MKISAKLLAGLAAALMGLAAQPAMAQTGSIGGGHACPEYDPPAISIVLNGGDVLQSQTKTAFQLAREKAVKYGQKMPLRQGSMGAARLRPDIKVDIVTAPDLGCLAVRNIDVKVYLDHLIEFAKEHEVGTCMQAEFFNLEMELSQLDEETVNTEILKMRGVLRQDIGTNYIYGPVSGVNLDYAKEEKAKEIEKLIRNRIAELETKIAKIRQESDLPEFYEEIETECAGGVKPKKH